MCNCRQETEARLLESLPEQLPKGIEGLKASLQGYALMFNGTAFSSCQVMPIEVTYRAPTKAGVMKNKKQSISMKANYCMFCGEKYLQEIKPDVEAGAA